MILGENECFAPWDGNILLTSISPCENVAIFHLSSRQIIHTFGASGMDMNQKYVMILVVTKNWERGITQDMFDIDGLFGHVHYLVVE